jgi:hypothetical protein
VLSRAPARYTPATGATSTGVSAHGSTSARRCWRSAVAPSSAHGSSSSCCCGFLIRLNTTAVVVVIALRVAGLAPSTLALGGAVTAVVVGLAAQQTLSHVIAGSVLASAQPFRVTVAGLLTLRDWLVAHGVTQVTMEATLPAAR